MSAFPEYIKYDGLDLAKLIRTKQVKPAELVEEAINRIETLNPKLNAVINKMYDQARKAAEKESHGSFAGVPVLLKDIGQSIEGELITSGSQVFKNYRAKKDSAIVSQLKQAGMLFLGHTNAPEFGLMAITEPSLHGPARNPWNLNYTPGGSSGGSAAAVAAGMVPIAGASDGGGSLRIPAAYCGLFGLKPTRGRTPAGLSGRSWQGAAVGHVITKTVRDSAAVLDELNVFEKSAAFHAPVFRDKYLQILNTNHEKKFKIAYCAKSPLKTEVHPECEKALMKTIKLLESMGHIVEEKEAPIDGIEMAKSFLTMCFGEVSAQMSDIEGALGRKVKFRDVEPSTWLFRLLGKTNSSEEFVMSMRMWDKAAYLMEDFFETYDFYVTPTTAFPPAKIGELDLPPFLKLLTHIVWKIGAENFYKRASIVDQAINTSLMRTPFTQLANMTGQPAMTVPLHMTPDNLPVGVQFMAARGREDLLFQIAVRLEQTEYWTDISLC